MKPITEQERQELIDWIPEHVDYLKSSNSKSTCSRLSVKALEIALASLTAMPFMIVDCDGEVDMGVTKDRFELFQDDERWLLYTAPPVPVIKFPDEEVGIGHSDYHAGKIEGYNECLEEVKHLNGIK